MFIHNCCLGTTGTKVPDIEVTRKVRGPAVVFMDARNFGCLERTGSTQLEKPECNYLYFSPFFCCLFFKFRGLEFDHIQFLLLCDQYFYLQYSLVSSLHFSKDPLLVFSVISSTSLTLFHFLLLLL